MQEAQARTRPQRSGPSPGAEPQRSPAAQLGERAAAAGPLLRGAGLAADRPPNDHPIHGSAQVQRREVDDRVALSDAAIRAEALRGLSSPPAQLPFAEQVQRSFGRHDLSRVQAHLGPAATAASQAIGARAYATGDHVVFAGQPDLHTVAHEAAHVVQQRGGIQLAGGVGRAGDPYEIHADAVADRVVAGRSVADLLDRCPCQDRAGPGGAVQMKPTWVDSSDQLVTAAKVTRGMQEYTLGHSFDAMAERERALRPEYNIRSNRNDTDLLPGSPNNAIPEIRILVVNGAGQAAQIAARIVSPGLDKFLVFRSTGDQGLRIRNTQNEEVVRSSDLQPQAYGPNQDRQPESFSPVGAYSFHDPSRAEQPGANAHERRHRSYDIYKEDHDTTYKSEVMEVEGKAGEHFHHSEQAVYKMLYEQPEIVFNALQQAEPRLVQELGADQDLEVLALSVDIFTTRSACPNCGGSADKLLGEHFFSLAQAHLNQQQRKTDQPEGGTYVIAQDYQRFIRFESDYAHGSTPGSAEEWQQANHGATPNVLHAPPRRNEAIPRPDQRQGSSGNSPVIVVSVPAKVNWEDAPVGRGDDEAPVYQRLVGQMRHMTVDTFSAIWGRVSSSPDLSLDEKRLFAFKAHLYMAKGDPGRQNAQPVAQRFGDAAFSFLRTKIGLGYGELINLVLRYYWEFADDLDGARYRLYHYLSASQLPVSDEVLNQRLALDQQNVIAAVGQEVDQKVLTSDPFDYKEAQFLDYKFNLAKDLPKIRDDHVKQAVQRADRVVAVQRGEAEKDWDDAAPLITSFETALRLLDVVSPEILLNWDLINRLGGDRPGNMLHPNQNPYVIPLVLSGTRVVIQMALSFLKQGA